MAMVEAESAAERIRPFLVGAARERRTVTYGEVADLIGVAPRSTTLRTALRILSQQEFGAGRGMISALVVRKDDSKPGKGFAGLAEELAGPVDDLDWFVEQEQKRVYEAHAQP